jgi:indole-3-glycerol phosphate synthase
MIQTVRDFHLPDELRGTVLEKIMVSEIRSLIGAQQKWPAEAIVMALEKAAPVRSLTHALLKNPPSVIAEIKRASPSAGVLRQEFDPIVVALEYQKGGAAAISVVTEATHFLGSLETIAHLRWHSKLPLLRKDFIVDPYRILEARHAGADAVLLIAALLDTQSLRNLRVKAQEYGMDALVEVHDRRELERALESGARLIGVNNRDLRTFQVSLETSLNLAAHFPKDVVAVSESGIKSAEDIRRLSQVGYRGFLVGEQLMRASSPKEALVALRAQGGMAAGSRA